MMNITEEQIKDVAEKEFINTRFDDYGADLKPEFCQSFIQGAKWMQEQLQPKWKTVTGIADLPTDDESYWCDVNGQVILLEADHMRRGTGLINRYTPFIKPVPPSW
ncbi:hypothetical protein IWX76_003602 [Pedobacter sp. CAN_A7]|uniref:hypothetical protein n=1 Tax=Pedobacter sp. CAN_A7 TaxID=2787722 RepID=UPI0018C9EE5A